VPAEGEQAGLVAADQRLEGMVVAPADERDQPLVALQPEQGLAPVMAGDPGVGESGDFHEGGKEFPSAKTRREQRSCSVSG